MTSGDENNHVSILLDIKEQQGAFGAQMLAAAQSRARMEKNIDELKDTIAQIKPVVAVVAEMKPDVEDLKKFKARVGSYVWVAGGIASGALYLLYQGIQFFSDNIKAALARVFH